MSKQYRVAVVGATGVVGQEMVRMLEVRHFPVKELKPYASEKSQGKTIVFKGKSVPVLVLSKDTISDVDIALFSAGASVSKEYAPIFAQIGAYVIDNSSAWRMDPACPLVVPEVNPQTVSQKTHIIANPNCSTIQMVVALKPLHDAAKIKRIVVSTYQSASGAGQRAMEDLREQTMAWSAQKPVPASKKLPQTIAFNVIPHIDEFTSNGYTKEEMKMVHETRKIMGDDSIRISSTTVRVPVFRSHSESVWIETEKKLTADQAKNLLKEAPGVVLLDDPEKKVYPLPIQAAGKLETYVGRIREDISCDKGLVLWVVSDNLLKGAAYNAVQIAELLVEKKIL